jgi:prepilin-type N-terminal cleavage/methylation domain-containing protein
MGRPLGAARLLTGSRDGSGRVIGVRRGTRRRSGFTLVEIVVAAWIVGILAAYGVPRIAEQVRRMRVVQAADLVTADLRSAFALAAEQRRTVRINYDGATTSYTLTDRTGAEVLRRRHLGTGSEWKLGEIRFEPLTIDISPNGYASAPLAVQLGNATTGRAISMTRTGIVRVVTVPVTP